MRKDTNLNFCPNCAKILDKKEDKCKNCFLELSELKKVSELEALAIAGSNRRFMTYFFDWVFLYVLFFIGIMVFAGSFEAGIPKSQDSNILLVSILTPMAYYIVCESIWQKTLGKKICGTKVVDISGSKPTFKQILGRTLTRYVPFDAISFGYQRPVGWHDSWSKTRVIMDR